MEARTAGGLLLGATALFAAALFVAAYFQADLHALTRIAGWGSLGLAITGAAVGVAWMLGRR